MNENSRQHLLSRLFARLYGHRLIRNDLRGELVEEIVAVALEPKWVLCGGDWAACDLSHTTTGLRMQVKQSAAYQSWTKDDSPAPKPRFSIAEAAGRYEGSTWIAGVGRNADLYVFAWNPIIGDTCDHADANQWQFHVVAERELPKQKSIGLRQLQSLGAAVPISSLKVAVDQVIAEATSPAS